MEPRRFVMDLGPSDPTVLTRQDKHISKKIWEEGLLCIWYIYYLILVYISDKINWHFFFSFCSILYYIVVVVWQLENDLDDFMPVLSHTFSELAFMA